MYYCEMANKVYVTLLSSRIVDTPDEFEVRASKIKDFINHIGENWNKKNKHN